MKKHINMDAGRELDKLVAEQVMGWKWLKAPAVGDVFMFSPEQLSNYTPEFIGANTVHDHDGDPPHRLPHYSTDIAAAWAVVERLLRKDGWRFAMAWYENEPVHASFCHGVPDVHRADAATASLAICLAALKAVEVP